MRYFEWEGAVIEEVSKFMAISHSVAAGVVEAQQFYMQQSWGKGMEPPLTAAKVIEAAQEQAEKRVMTTTPSKSACCSVMRLTSMPNGRSKSSRPLPWILFRPTEKNRTSFAL